MDSLTNILSSIKALFTRPTVVKQTKSLTKSEYIAKWEIAELFDDLYKGIALLNKIEAGRTDNPDWFVKFKEAYIEQVYEIEGDNIADFTIIWEWFTPYKDWDGIIGEEGNELQKEIFRRVDRWKRNQGFLPGTKLFLSGEYGVVMNTEGEDDEAGLIRWDSSKKNDLEDWRGLFESFLAAGGEIVNQDHQFQFVNDDGSVRF